jgi:hypothetical protein
MPSSIMCVSSKGRQAFRVDAWYYVVIQFKRYLGAYKESVDHFVFS